MLKLEVNRREFVKIAAGTGAALAMPTFGLAAPSSKMIGIQVGAVSFVDEGTEKVLDVLQERACVNTLFLAVFTYGRGIAGRQIPGQPLPDHGKQEYDLNFHGGNFATPHPQYYKNTVFKLGSSGPLTYTCTYTGNPTLVSGTNTASVTETSTTDTGATDPNKGQPGIVPGSPKPGTAGYTFPTLTVTDNVQDSANPSGCTATLGTVTAVTSGTTVSTSPGCGVTSLSSSSWGVFKYSITDANSSPGTCTSYNNTAMDGGSSSDPVTVTVCNTNTGALAMDF